MCIDENSKKAIIDLFERYEEDIYTVTKKDKEIVNEICKIEEKFYDGLTNEQKEVYEKLDDLKLQSCALEDKKIFVYAYSLATKLIIEGLN